MSLQTTLGIAKIGTKSLRVTVPEGVVAYLDLRSGDKLEWRMEIENGEKVVLVRKAGLVRSASRRENVRQ
jgi:bifunctional DNA-binding transcriptional regulator/antitoxin component of YhaV-PrlF toxin-antitoxin module